MKFFEKIITALACAIVILAVLNALNFIRWRWIIILSPRLILIICGLLLLYWAFKKL